MCTFNVLCTSVLFEALIRHSTKTHFANRRQVLSLGRAMCRGRQPSAECCRGIDLPSWSGRSGLACASPKPRCSFFPGNTKLPLGASSRLMGGLRLCLCVPIGATLPSSRPSVSFLGSLVRPRLGWGDDDDDGKMGSAGVVCRVSALAVTSRANRRRSECAVCCLGCFTGVACCFSSRS